MKPLVRYTALLLASVFLAGAVAAWVEVLTHENVLQNPQTKIASGWLMTGLMLLALGLRGWRARRAPKSANEQAPR